MHIKSLMPYRNAVKEKLAAGKPAKGMFYCNSQPSYVEMVGYSGMDFVVIDTEHGPNGMETVEALIRAAEVSGMATFVRVSENSPSLILRALDLGAGGVVVPQVNTAAGAAAAVKAAKYAPQGERGVAGIVRAARYGNVPLADYLEYSNANTMILTQVEHVEAVANLDEILAVEGLDGILIGPSDLSQSMGVTGQFDNEELRQVIADIIRRGVAAGKVVAIFCLDTADAKHWQSLGANVLSIGSDSMLFVPATRKIVKDFGF